MNKVILMGRLTRNPEVRYTQGNNAMAIGKYTLAVDRRGARDGQTADFINCIAFGKSAEFAEKYLQQGTKVVVTGRIQTGSYTNNAGQKVYTTDVVVEDQEFAESKINSGSTGTLSRPATPAPTQAQNRGMNSTSSDGFMEIPDNIDEELPFV